MDSMKRFTMIVIVLALLPGCKSVETGLSYSHGGIKGTATYNLEKQAIKFNIDFKD
jgi:uncharacterized protein YceK